MAIVILISFNRSRTTHVCHIHTCSNISLRIDRRKPSCPTLGASHPEALCPSMMALPVGMWVQIATRTRCDYNKRFWQVVGAEGDRLLLRDEDDSVPGGISVERAVCTSLALVLLPAEGDAAAWQPEDMMMPPAYVHPRPTRGPTCIYLAENPNEPDNLCDMFGFLKGHDQNVLADMLGTWWILPGLGDNSFMVRMSTDHPPPPPLVLFPWMHDQNLEVWFWSEWGQEMIRLEGFDMFKMCPAGQMWPWCMWCQKFLLPVMAHRHSAHHERAIRWLMSRGVDWGRGEMTDRFQSR